MLIRQLWGLLPSKRRLRLVLVLVMAVVAAIAEGAVVLLVNPLISGLMDGEGNSSTTTGPLVVFGLALIGKNMLVVALSWFKNRELFGIQAETSERLLDIYIRGTNPAIRDLDAGERTSFAITEPLQLVLNCYLPLVTIAAESLALMAVVTVLLVEHPIETLLLVAVLGVGLKVFSLATRARIIDSGRRRKDSDTRRVELVRSIIESRAEVNGLGVSEEVLGRYRRPNRESAEMTARKGFLTEASKNVLEILIIAAVGPLALLFMYADGTDLLALLAMFGLAAYRAMPALNRIMVSTQSLKFGVATADTIHGIFVMEPATPTATPSGDRSPEVIRGDGSQLPVLELAFHGFRLRNGKLLLEGRSVCLRPGDVCVVWGVSGSGKSTLLEALIDGAPGVEIRYRGRTLDGGLSELVGRVGVTAQSPLILPATLRENLTLGQPGPGDPDLAGALPMLDEDPQSILYAPSIEDRLDRPIHRHAVSGGQAQRISLIRALDASHEMVLLDEPTSALDFRTASALRDRIASDDGDRVFVMVTHDPELRRIADVVVEVE